MNFTKGETVLGVVTGTLLLILVGWVVSSFGMPSPEQRLAYTVMQHIESDGVEVDATTCAPWPGAGVYKCRVNLSGGGLTSVLVRWYEDGSWGFVSPDDRP